MYLNLNSGAVQIFSSVDYSENEKRYRFVSSNQGLRGQIRRVKIFIRWKKNIMWKFKSNFYELFLYKVIGFEHTIFVG